MGSPIILFEGNGSTKRVDGTKMMLAPFAGVSERNGIEQFGIGYISFGNEVFFYPTGIVDVITARRALEIASRRKEGSYATLAGNWMAASPYKRYGTSSAVIEAENDIGQRNLSSIVQMDLRDGQKTLDLAIERLRKEGFIVDARSLVEEWREGRLNETPAIKAVLLPQPAIKTIHSLELAPTIAYQNIHDGNATQGEKDLAARYVIDFEIMIARIGPTLKEYVAELPLKEGESMKQFFDTVQRIKSSDGTIETRFLRYHAAFADFLKAFKNMKRFTPSVVGSTRPYTSSAASLRRLDAAVERLAITYLKDFYVIR